MKRIGIALLVIFGSTAALSAEVGEFALGARTTLSTFGHANGNGLGAGGQFRIRFHDLINTEWFADVITTNIDGVAFREDYHIGWSVMFYPFQPVQKAGHFAPYVIAGHCFDYTEVSELKGSKSEARWSSAAQAGLGLHLFLSRYADLALNSQYMLHIGNDIHTHTTATGVEIQKDSESLEGHLLFTLSVNYILFDLW